MKRPIIGLLILAIAALFGATAFQNVSSRTLFVIEHITTDEVIDVGEAGDTVGDVLVTANGIYDETNQTLLGTNQGYCVRTVPGVSRQCTWTLVLADGQIMVQGMLFDGLQSVVAITGGTGAYRGARGQMTMYSHNDDGTQYALVYEITG